MFLKKGTASRVEYSGSDSNTAAARPEMMIWPRSFCRGVSPLLRFFTTLAWSST